MSTKSIYFIFMLLFTPVTFGQEDSVFIEKAPVLYNPITNEYDSSIKPKTTVKIWLKNTGPIIEGKIKYLNDSTLLINTTPIFINDIEKIRVRNKQDHATASLISIGGCVIILGSAVLISNAKNMGVVSGPIAKYVGIAGLIIGVPTVVAGIVDLFTSGSTYKMDIWEIQFK